MKSKVNQVLARGDMTAYATGIVSMAKSSPTHIHVVKLKDVPGKLNSMQRLVKHVSGSTVAWMKKGKFVLIIDLEWIK